MRLEDVTAEIRPRSDAEAVDLGFALARRDFRRAWAGWWMAMGPPGVVLGVVLWNHPAWFLFLFWLVKPAGMRMVLWIISRRLFGAMSSWREMAREVPQAWTRRFFQRFLWQRLSPWLPVTLAVEDLERLRGREYRLRCGQIRRRGGGQVAGLYLLGDLFTCWIALALVLLFQTFLPMGREGIFDSIRESYDPADPMAIPLEIIRGITGFVVVAMSLVDVFLTGAGFGIYLNNRTWIEGWDVELAFRRLAKRLTGD